ncbi:MAG: phospholipid carrier-dependent glycosyltransferase, partial [Actinobacteria bacterium]
GAAAAVALNPDHVFHSRFVAPDVIATFFATATVLAAVGIAKKGTWRDYLLAGVLTGLAAGTKYNAGLVFIAVAAAHVARLDLRSPFRPRDLLFLIGAAAAAAAAFLLSTPALIVEPGTVVGAVLGIGRTYGTGHPGQDGGQVVWYARNIWVTFGPLALFFAASAWSAMRRKDRVLAAAMVFPVVYLVFLCLFTVRNERVMLPVVPVFAVISVAGAFMSADLVPSGAPARWARTAAPAVLAALLVVPAARAFACSRSYAGPQAQAEARQWIDANLPRDARIVVENYGPYVFDTHPGATATDYLGHASADAYRDEGVEYLVASKDAFGRFYTDPGSSAVYLTARDNYESFRKEFRALATFTDATQHGVIVYAVSP